MTGLASHVKRHIVRGTRAVIPLVLSFPAVRFVYTTVDQRVIRPLERFLPFEFPGLGLLLVLLTLYLAGLFATNHLGRRLGSSQILDLHRRLSSRLATKVSEPSSSAGDPRIPVIGAPIDGSRLPSQPLLGRLPPEKRPAC